MGKNISNAIEILVFTIFIIGITFVDLSENILNLTMIGAIILGVDILLTEREENKKK